MNSTTAVNIDFTPQIRNSFFLSILSISCKIRFMPVNNMIQSNTRNSHSKPVRQIVNKSQIHNLLMEWIEMPCIHGRVCLTWDCTVKGNSSIMATFLYPWYFSCRFAIINLRFARNEYTPKLFVLIINAILDTLTLNWCFLSRDH